MFKIFLASLVLGVLGFVTSAEAADLKVSPRYNKATSQIDFISLPDGKVLYSQPVTAVTSDSGETTLLNAAGVSIGNANEFSETVKTTCSNRRTAVGWDASSPKLACNNAKAILVGCSNIDYRSVDAGINFRCYASACCD